MSISTEATGRASAADRRPSLTEPQRALFDRLTQSVAPWAERAGFASRTGDGRFIGPFNPAPLSPAIAGSFLDFQAAEEEGRTLSDRVRQVVILAVGAGGSAYELYAQSAAARTAGLLEEAVNTLVAGGVPDELSHAERCAWRFAQLSADRRIDQAVYDEAQEAFGSRGLVNMLFLIGAYHAVCGLLNAFDIPAPE